MFQFITLYKKALWNLMGWEPLLEKPVPELHGSVMSGLEALFARGCEGEEVLPGIRIIRFALRTAAWEKNPSQSAFVGLVLRQAVCYHMKHKINR